MNSEAIPVSSQEDGLNRRYGVRSGFLVAVLALGLFFGWALWPPRPDVSPYQLSRVDGKPRFFATQESTIQEPGNLSLQQRLLWRWQQYKRHRAKKNPAAHSFPPASDDYCDIPSRLNQCMELTGTQYLVAVEIVGVVKFRNTNTLNGAQWVAAFEKAIEESGPIVCYDYAQKTNFQDTLLLIRERPGLAKVVPRGRLADYQRAGLVTSISR